MIIGYARVSTSRVNFIISFVVGFFTGGAYLILSFGPLLLWPFLFFFFWPLHDRESQRNLRYRRGTYYNTRMVWDL